MWLYGCEEEAPLSVCQSHLLPKIWRATGARGGLKSYVEIIGKEPEGFRENRRGLRLPEDVRLPWERETSMTRGGRGGGGEFQRERGNGEREREREREQEG